MLKDRSGFTLLEVLYSLFIFSLIIFGINASYHHYQRLEQHTLQSRVNDWYQFKLTLRHELKYYDFVGIKFNQITVKDKTTKERATIALNGRRIYKTPGYQPYLYDVKSFLVTEYEHGCWVMVEFSNGEVYEDWITLEK